MEATTFPTAEQAITIIRKQARHAQPPVPQPAQRSPIQPEQPVTAETLRSRVLDAFRTMAHGTDAPTAHEHTKAFYRSSGMEWALSLTEQGGHELQNRVLQAFRGIAHGVRDRSAHASSLAFYRSGGQAWVKNLG
jgi:hypothetical protein